MAPLLHQLPARAAHSHTRIHVVVETPKGSRNKAAFGPELGTFKLKGVLPEGHSFPYNFGFVPFTKTADGNPLAVLLLLDAPAFPGCLVEARVLGALEIAQHETAGTVEHNDRLLAVAADSREHKNLHTLADLSADMLHELAHFFHSNNEAKGGEIKMPRRVGFERTHELLAQAQRSLTCFL